MLNIQVRNMLIEIAKTAFPEVKHHKFYLVIENKELDSKNGDWTREGKQYPSMAEIRVFNLSRGTRQIIKTSIHELTHNTEDSIYGDTGHSPRFYFIYKKLFEAAIDLGLLTAEDVNSIAETRDIKQMIKHHGPIDRISDSNQAYKDDMAIIKIKNSFTIKDQLKERGYKWNSIDSVWMIEIEKEVLEEEKQFLLSITSEENIIISDYSNLEIEATGYLIVGGKSYSVKDKLKERGYIFNGYFQTGNVWVKKFPMTELKREEIFLTTLSDEITVKLMTKK